MKKLKTIGVLLLSLASLAGHADTAKKKPAPVPPAVAKPASAPAAPAEKAAPKPAPLKFSMELIAGETLDPAYVGISPADLVKVVEDLTAVSKGEFESTQEFNARRDAALQQRFLDGYAINDVFAFIAPVTKSPDAFKAFRYSYDADLGEAQLYILPRSSPYIPLNGIGAPGFTVATRREGRGLDQFVLSQKLDSQSTYQGSNAYGATVTVAKTEMTNVGLAAFKIPFLRFERDINYPRPQVAARLRIDPAHASKELPELKALLVVKLASPYMYYNFQRVEPKRDNPVDISVREKYLAGDVLGVIFYSGLTGQILARVPEGFGTPQQPLEKGVDENRVLSSDFYEGKLRLTYSMFGRGAADSAELRTLYDQKNWKALVASVIKKRYVVDTYYFYLGRAAEELKAPEAAKIYYDLALKSDKCTTGGMWNTCAGFEFPADVEARKRLMGTP